MKLTDHLLRFLRKDAPATASLSSEADARRQALIHSYDIYCNRAPWLSHDNRGLSLAAGIVSEISRLTLTEFSASFGEGRAEARLRASLAPFLSRLRSHVSLACATGGVMLKPCYDGKTLGVECYSPFDFQPLMTDGCGNITACAFFTYASKHGKDYLRVEEHRPCERGYRIKNTAYRLEADRSVPCSLGEIAAWASLAPEVVIAPLASPLFSYFGMPLTHPTLPDSPLGVPIFRPAEALICEADRQFGRLLWEFEGGELAVDCSEEAFRIDRDGELSLPLGKERLYRINALDACSSSQELMTVFAPTLRDKSLINGLNRILMFVEDACGIARGTFSDPTEVAKTATEVRSMRQRTYSTVTAIQRSLSTALTALVEGMNALAALYGLWQGKAHPTFRFGDGVLSDTESERAIEREEVKAGILSAEDYKRRWYSSSQEESI